MPAFKNTREIKVGVIGYGGAYNMGRKHLEEMRKAGMTPVAVAELDEARLAVAEQDFPGIETYTDVRKMLKQSDVNLITIITPHNTHAPLAVQCLSAGKHIVCEKPLAITTAECDRMIRTADKKKLMVSTYHNRHWDGCILSAVKKIKQQGVIGDVFKAELHMGGYGPPGPRWRSSKTVSGGIMYDWGVHLLEYTLQIFDSDIVEVAGFAKTGYWQTQLPKAHPWKKDLNEAEGNAIVRFKGGELLNLCISSVNANPKPGMVEFFGTKGSYVMNHHEHTIITSRRKKVDGKWKAQRVEKTVKNVKGQQDKFYKNIAEHLTGKAKLIITPQWSRRPIHILDLAHRSAERNRTLKAKYA